MDRAYEMTQKSNKYITKKQWFKEEEKKSSIKKSCIWANMTGLFFSGL